MNRMSDREAAPKVRLELPVIAQRLKGMRFPEVDHVVGIATGGVVPASLIAYAVERPLSLLHINFRAASNLPQRDAPELVSPFLPEIAPCRVLLVDDVSVTGRTLSFAASLLPEHRITTCVLKGEADLVVFPEVASCVAWPWKS